MVRAQGALLLLGSGTSVGAWEETQTVKEQPSSLCGVVAAQHFGQPQQPPTIHHHQEAAWVLRQSGGVGASAGALCGSCTPVYCQLEMVALVECSRAKQSAVKQIGRVTGNTGVRVSLSPDIMAMIWL